MNLQACEFFTLYTFHKINIKKQKINISKNTDIADHKMLFLRTDTVKMSKSLGDNVHDLVNNMELSLKRKSLSTIACFLRKNFDGKTCKKQNLSHSTVLTSMIPNMIEKSDSSCCNPPSKNKKYLRFDLSATSIHNLERPLLRFKNKSERISETIGERLVQQNEIFFSTEQDPTLCNEDQMIESMWYSHSELNEIRLRAYYLSKNVQLDSELMESYNKCRQTNYQHRKNDNILLQRLSQSQITQQSSNPANISCNKLDDFILQRGLERWSSTGLAFHRKTDSVVWKTSFFLEQMDQMISGEYDPITLANICHAGSMAVKKFALLLASIDAYDLE